jgi:ATP-dependent helicase Lhr and Lhr-like helicase
MQSAYKSFLERYGSFTEIQEKAIGPITQGRDCLITAPTGSGKTEAALLPTLSRLLQAGAKGGIRVVYITPLRALNRDLVRRIVLLSDELGITAEVRHGDTGAYARKKQVEKPPEVLITTPESLQNIFLSKRLRESLKNVKAVIIDEVHELYYNKRGAQLAVALERMLELSGDFQRIGISATVGDVDSVARFLFADRKYEIVRSAKTKAFELKVEMPRKSPHEYAQFKKKAGLDEQSMARLAMVAELIRSSLATLVFVNTRQVAESLGSKLILLNNEFGFGSIGIHHSSLDKDERVEVENSFKEGRLKGIVATSSLELGIDIGKIDLVVQYGSPKQAIRLVQRIGRGGHRENITAKGEIIVADVLDAVESAVICNFAAEGRLERQKVETNALDVLVNQICALSLEYRSIDAEKAFNIVRRSFPYQTLSRETFERLLQFAAEARLITLKEGRIGLGGRGIQYFINNISVIPDRNKFIVKNVITNKRVSVLDESFVYSYVEPGASFITKGLPWKVVGIEGDVIFVEPAKDIEASVPDWDGEDIPVSHEIAEATFASFRAPEQLKGNVNGHTYDEILAFQKRQGEYFTPTARTVFVEELENHAIIYIPLGKLANEFLGRVIGAVIVSEVGGGAVLRATPYAIVINYATTRKTANIKRVMKALENFDFYKNSDLITGSELFRYKFVQVAKLFGVVEKKANITKAAATKLVSFYRNSQIFDETVRDLNKNYFDAETVYGFIEKLRQGEIKICEFKSAGSPLSKEILMSAYHYKELLLPVAPSDSDITTFKEKFREKEMRLLCTYCGFSFSVDVGTEKDVKFLCKRCKSPQLVIYSGRYDEVMTRKLEGKALNAGDAKVYDEIVTEAGLVSAYGNRAIIALSTYGVGISTAARVLKLFRRDYKSFYIDLIEAQKNFVRTKQFWKDR